MVETSYGPMYYEITGDESFETVMFLHGVSMDHSAFDANVDGLKDEFRVLTVDLPGHGQSYVPKQFFYKESMQALLELLDHLKLDAVHVAGVSLGGHLAQYLAHHHPRRVKSVIDIGSLPLHRKLPLIYRTFMKPLLHLTRLIPEASFCKYFVNDKAVEPDNREYLRQSAEQTGKQRILKYSFSMAEEARHPIREAVQQPTLIIHGEQDAKFLIKAGDRWHRGAANTERHILKHAGHVATGDQPDAINEILRDFLKRQA